MSGEKRAASATFGSSQVVKRQKSSADINGSSLVRSNGGQLVQGAYSSNADGLQAKVMEMSGHTAEVFAARFSPDSSMIVSGSMDHNILLWRSTGSCENLGLLAGHKSAVLDLQWSRDGQVVYSASADAHLMSWDVEAGVRVRKHPGHEEVINCLDVSKRGEEFLVSGSDDGFISIWDPRQKSAMDYIETNMPVTAVCLSDAGNEFFSGSIDNNIKVWDLRMKKTSYSLPGHTDTITSLALSPDSQTLLSFSHDSTVRTWDVRPFAAANRHIRIYDGAQIGLERNLVRARWDGEGKRIAVGGGDGTVTVWETTKGKMLHKLPGHKGCVNDVGISKDGSMILSASTDRTMLLGELPG